MRRIFIGALTAFGTLALAVAPATAQYVNQPGQTPRVSGAGFGGQSVEVLGDSVTRDDSAGVAGIAGEPARPVQTADVVGVEATRTASVNSAREAGTSRSGSTRGGTSALAFTGISLAALLAASAGLVGIGAALRRFARPQTA